MTDALAVRVGGLVLAAGEGRRLGRIKPLVRHRGRYLIEHAIALLADGGCAPIVVVLGAHADEIERATLSPPPAATSVVRNPDWASGLGSSFRAGLAACETITPPVDAVVIGQVDQPFLTTETVRRLVAAHTTGAAAAVPTYAGQPGTPVLLSRTHWPAAAATATGDVGARPFLRSHPDLVTYVACDDTGSPADIDRPEDLTGLAD